MYDIIIGRDEEDKKKFGTEGTILIGKHYIKMGRTTTLSNKIYMDMIRSHVVFICGKRGSGKSYTMGVIAEGVADLPTEIKQNISIIFLDTMGVYWTMKYPNKQDRPLLDDWELKSKGLDVKIYTPSGYHESFKKKGIPSDFPFSIKASELDADDWCVTFDIKATDPIGVFIERIIHDMKEKLEDFTIKDIINVISKDKEAENTVKNAAKNRFRNATNWGLFSEEGTLLKDLAKGGQVSILDVSCYATMPNSWNVRAW